MATTTVVPGPASSTALVIPKRQNAAWAFTKAQPLGAFGVVVISVYFICALGANWMAPYDPEAVDFAAMLSPPGREHWFGTDQYGRDVLSRIMYGTRTALAVASATSWIASGDPPPIWTCSFSSNVP